jgi:hypothetical protein
LTRREANSRVGTSPTRWLGRTPTGFPAAARLNRMGRRFSSHGLLISRACRIWQTLHVRLLSSSLSHSACTLRAGISTGHFDECGRSTGGRLSICFAERLSPQCLSLLASTSCRSWRRIRRCTASVRRPSTSCIDRALHRADGIRKSPFGTLLRFAALHVRSTGHCY